MSLESIRLGSSGPSVEAWQYFLLGLGFYVGVVDGKFRMQTDIATKKFQKEQKISADGWVGTTTYAVAMLFGFDPLKYYSEDTVNQTSPAWPPCPPNVSPLTVLQKNKLFGAIEYKLVNNPKDPEAITITNGWGKNIELVELPLLNGCPGATKNGKYPFHKKAVKQVVSLFDAWQPKEKLILSFAGSWVPRMVRGSRTNLSSHAWGVAFDINAGWNGLGQRPALVGEAGSVRELVEVAVEHGFFWGGWFTRKDGMHFELREIQG